MLFFCLVSNATTGSRNPDGHYENSFNENMDMVVIPSAPLPGKQVLFNPIQDSDTFFPSIKNFLKFSIYGV